MTFGMVFVLIDEARMMADVSPNRSCGGCPNEDREEYAGEDCTEIPNADSVQCHKGKCVVREWAFILYSSASGKMTAPVSS